MPVLKVNNNGVWECVNAGGSSSGTIEAKYVVGLDKLLAQKVDAVEGKGLSTNDYTDDDKKQLADVANLVGDTKVSEQINDAMESHTHSEYAAQNHEHNAYALSNHEHTNYAVTDHSHTEFSSKSHDHANATKFASGFMSAADKTTLDNLDKLVGDTAVSTQIASAINGITPGKTLTQHFAAEKMVLSSLQYGDNLPSAGTIGRIFFKRATEEDEEMIEEEIEEEVIEETP